VLRVCEGSMMLQSLVLTEYQCVTYRQMWYTDGQTDMLLTAN